MLPLAFMFVAVACGVLAARSLLDFQPQSGTHCLCDSPHSPHSTYHKLGSRRSVQLTQLRVHVHLPLCMSNICANTSLVMIAPALVGEGTKHRSNYHASCTAPRRAPVRAGAAATDYEVPGRDVALTQPQLQPRPQMQQAPQPHQSQQQPQQQQPQPQSQQQQPQPQQQQQGGGEPQDASESSTAPVARVDASGDVTKPEYTLPQWQHEVQCSRAIPGPGTVLRLAHKLQRVCQFEVQADVDAVLQDTLSLLLEVPLASGSEACLLDAVAQCFAVHPALLSAANANAEASELLDVALEQAAAVDVTYTEKLLTAQMATAQLKLRRYCEAYWQRLEHCGLQHLGTRQVATVVHRAATLTEAIGAPPPAAALWAAMQSAMVEHTSAMTSQEVGNCVIACAKLKRFPGNTLACKLLPAVQRVSGEMAPQDVALMLWALTKLRMPIGDKLREALLAAALRTCAGMKAQEVAITLYALAKLRCRPVEALCHALCSAVLREAERMTPQGAITLWALGCLQIIPATTVSDAVLERVASKQDELVGQDVANVLWAVATLQTQVSPTVRAALLAAALSTCAQDMNMVEVSSMMSSLNKLRWPLSPQLQLELCYAAARTSPQMNAQAIALTLYSVASLQLQPSDTVRRLLTMALDRQAMGMTSEGADMCVNALRQLHWPVLDTTRATIDAKLRRPAPSGEAASSCR